MTQAINKRPYDRETDGPFDLRAARIDSGLTISAFAEAIGITAASYRRLEAGTPTSPALAKRVADHYGVRVTDLPAFAPMKGEAA